MLVTVINRTDDMILVGPKYLLPNEGRRVTLSDYLQARRQHGAGDFDHAVVLAPLQNTSLDLLGADFVLR